MDACGCGDSASNFDDCLQPAPCARGTFAGRGSYVVAGIAAVHVHSPASLCPVLDVRCVRL